MIASVIVSSKVSIRITINIKNISISSCYRMVPSEIREMLSEFLIFCNLLEKYETLSLNTC